MSFVEVVGRKTLDPETVDVCSVMVASNTVQVSFDEHDGQEARAMILGATHGKQFGVFMHFWLLTDCDGILMRWDNTISNRAEYDSVLEQAEEYLGQMGYLVEDKHYEEMNAMDQGDILGSLTLFGGGDAALEKQAESSAGDPIPMLEEVVVAGELSTAMLVEADDRVKLVPESKGLEENWQVVVKYLASF